MKKIITCIAACVMVSATAIAQSIMTASDFFKSVSDYYGTIHDYEADVDITIGNSSDMQGKASFKRPEMLRIDFSQPAEQTIVFSGDTLTIYLPAPYSAILQQTVSGSGAASATPEGLALMRRYYTISYESGQDPVPLEEGSSEMVINLVLKRRSSSEAFSQIKLSIDPTSKLIRRVIAVTPSSQSYIFYFSNYRLNTGMSEQRFIYDPPSSANNYNNFLFSE
ncbi:MAG: outer membrane lipoprotein carrier protein LolA [Treponema sp.]|nr:outer membrane lipoprotein carrier protein LolA [Treponema sp.]